MQKLFKGNGQIIKKLLLYQFGGAMLGIMMSSASMQNLTLNCLTSIFAIIFYLFLVYTALWEVGAKDRIRVDGGRAEKDMNRGLKAAVAANLPNIILGVLTVFGTLVGVISQWAWAGSLAVFTNVAARFWQGMYNGIINTVIPKGLGGTATIFSSLIFIAIIIPALLVAWIAYKRGYDNKKIFNPQNKNAD